jgi:hypothetical protein
MVERSREIFPWRRILFIETPVVSLSKTLSAHFFCPSLNGTFAGETARQDESGPGEDPEAAKTAV